MGAQLWCRVLRWTLFAGSWWLVEPACGETQEEQLLGVSRDNLSVTWNSLERVDLPSCCNCFLNEFPKF